jgi:hypothetical protein
MMFTVSEAKRFPEWLERILHIFTTEDQTMIGRFFGDLFHNWSTTSRTVLAGPAKFDPIFRYLTYKDVVVAITVLRNRVKVKQRVVHKEEEMKKKDLLLLPRKFLAE